MSSAQRGQSADGGAAPGPDSARSEKLGFGQHSKHAQPVRHHTTRPDGRCVLALSIAPPQHYTTPFR